MSYTMNPLTDHEKINKIIWGTRHVFTTGEAYRPPQPRPITDDSNNTSSTRDRSPIDNIRGGPVIPDYHNSPQYVDLITHNSCLVKPIILNSWYLTKLEWSEHEKYA